MVGHDLQAAVDRWKSMRRLLAMALSFTLVINQFPIAAALAQTGEVSVQAASAKFSKRSTLILSG